MRRKEVLRVVEQIEQLLSTHGHKDKAGWMSGQASALRAAQSEHEVRTIFDRLHSVVPGMGGLMDLQLVGQSGEVDHAARQALDAAADRLYELTC